MNKLPLIMERHCRTIAKSLRTGLYYQVEDSVIDVSDPLIGVDEDKYESTETEIGFQHFKLKKI